MSRMTALLASVAALAVACEPEVGERENPTVVDVALFDLQATPQPLIPTPNDIIPLLQPGAPATVPTTPGQAGTTVRVLFGRQTVQANGTILLSAPPIDPATAVAPRVLVVPIAPQPGLPVPDSDLTKVYIPATLAAPAVPSGVIGALVLIKNTPWAAGTRYAVLVRAGPNGLRTVDDRDIEPSPTMFFLTGDGSLTDPTRPSPIPGASAEQLGRLEALRTQAIRPVVEGLIQAGVIQSADDVASVQTFTTAP